MSTKTMKMVRGLAVSLVCAFALTATADTWFTENLSAFPGTAWSAAQQGVEPTDLAAWNATAKALEIDADTELKYATPEPQGDVQAVTMDVCFGSAYASFDDLPTDAFGLIAYKPADADPAVFAYCDGTEWVATEVAISDVTATLALTFEIGENVAVKQGTTTIATIAKPEEMANEFGFLGTGTLSTLAGTYEILAVAFTLPTVEHATVTADATSPVQPGTEVTFTVTANEGYAFADTTTEKTFKQTIAAAGAVEIPQGVDVTTKKILPTATAATVTVAGLDGAATFTAGGAAPLFADWTADFILTADQDFAKDDILLVAVQGEQVPLALTADYTAGTEISIMDALRAAIQMPSFNVTYADMLTMGSFTCGVSNVALKNDTAFTIKLVLSNGGESLLLATTEEIKIAKKIVLPTATGGEVQVDGLDAAVSFTLEDAGIGYDNWNADFIVKFDKDIAAGEVTLKGQYGELAWTALPDAAYTAGEGKGVMATLDKTVNVSELAEFVKTFQCGIVNNTVKSDVEVTVQLVITDGETTLNIGMPIRAMLPAAQILPTATVAKATAEGYDAVVKFTAEDAGNGYDDWKAKFILTSDVAIGADEIALGGQYGTYPWTDITFAGCEAGAEVSIAGDLDITVADTFNLVKEFQCGVKNIGLKNDATFSIKLVITDGETTKEICKIADLAVAKKAGWDIKPEDADKAAQEAWPTIPNDLAQVPAGRLSSWAKANNIPFGAEFTPVMKDAYLLDCAPDKVEETKAQINIASIEFVNGEWVVKTVSDDAAGDEFGNGKLALVDVTEAITGAKGSDSVKLWKMELVPITVGK